MKTNKILATLWDYFLMTVGSIIFCMAWTSFIIPTGLASGGLTGFCTIIQYGTGLPVGISYPILNVLLLLFDVAVYGFHLFVKSGHLVVKSADLFLQYAHESLVFVNLGCYDFQVAKSAVDVFLR